MTTVDKTQGIRVDLFERPLEHTLHRPGPCDVQAIVDNAYKKYAGQIAGAVLLKERYAKGLPIFVRINSGARTGSIARIDPAFIDTTNPAYLYYNMPDLFTDNTLIAIVFGNGNHIKTHLNFSYMIVVKDAIRLKLNEKFVYIFDEKTVKTNFKDQEGLEFLPLYDGPTVSCYTAKPKGAPKVEGPPFAHEPIDTFGHTLAIGDMFIHGRSNDLIFGYLEGVTPAGTLIYRSLFGKSGQRLQSSDLVACVRGGQPSRSLMKFSKGEVLSTRLMMEKLAKL